MIGPAIDFDWMEKCLRCIDVNESHRWNYLRHRLWEREQKKKLLKPL